MRTVAAKVQVRTPEQMAKAIMKQSALKELAAARWDNQATVTVEYMGHRHTLSAPVTVNVKNGQIIFHFGATGQNRLLFPIHGKEYAFGVGGNIMTGEAIDDWQEIRAKYKLEELPSLEESADLDAGETTE